MQLFGCGGCNGCLARSHLFYSEQKDRKGKTKAIKDGVLSDFITGAQNCTSAFICGIGEVMMCHQKDVAISAHHKQLHPMTECV